MNNDDKIKWFDILLGIMTIFYIAKALCLEVSNKINNKNECI